MDKALLVIDMQQEMQARIDAGRPQASPDAPAIVARLIAAFRRAGHAVIHIHHAASDPLSPLHPDAPGYPAMPCARPEAGEPVFVKCSSSAFATTQLERHLRAAGSPHLHIVGAVAGFCVNSTVRAAADIGFRVSVVADGVLGFDLPSAGLDAATIFDVTMGLLAADFADVTDSGAVIAAL